MKITFEIDTKDEDADEYLKLINNKAKAYVGANDLCELYRRIYNRKIYDENVIKVEKNEETGESKEWISLDYIEHELEEIFETLKEFQYWD